jgi:hypothetical protein
VGWTYILKRLATSTREMKYIQLDPDHFDAALLYRHSRCWTSSIIFHGQLHGGLVTEYIRHVVAWEQDGVYTS